MAKENNVSDFFKDFAEAIRAKVRYIGAIKPIDIPDIIESADPTKFGRFSEEATVSLKEGISGIKTISFHPGVTTIYKEAYSNMSSIDILVLPDNLEKIEESAFQGCSSLTEISIPDSVTIIGKNAFKGCSNVETLIVPTTTRVSDLAGFKDTKWYKKQPDGVVYIGRNAYRYKGTMPEGTSIKIKDGTLVVTMSAFSGKSNLAQIEFPDTIVLFGTGSFEECLGLQKIEIPGSKVTIGFAAFSGCKNLKEVYINDVTYFDVDSFNNCSNLTKLTIMNSETIPNVGTNAFNGIDKNELIIYVANEEMREKFKASNNWGSYNIQIAEQIN